MSKWITPLLKLMLLCGSSLVFAGEPAAESVKEAALHASSSDSGVGLGGLLRVVFSFLFIIALMLACAWWLKRWQPGMGSGGGGMRVRSVLSLGGRDRLVVVEAGERQLLLGVSPGRVVLLGDYDQLLPEEPPPLEGDVATRFRQLLKR